MPIGHHVETHQNLIVCRLYGQITETQIIDLIGQVGRKTTKPGIWRSLVVLEDGLDISDIGVVDLERVRGFHEMLYQHPGVTRGMGAAVIHARDAEIVMPFYNAMCGDSHELKAGFRLFDDIDPAVDWLGISAEHGKALVERTAPADAPEDQTSAAG